jgi:hypothetical protein
MKERERKKKIKINKAKRRKRSGYKKELKRFDPILKEIFSKAAGKIISLATGEKIEEKLEDITSEIEFVKSLRPDLLFRTKEKIFILKFRFNMIEIYPKGCWYILWQLRKNLVKNPCR